MIVRLQPSTLIFALAFVTPLSFAVDCVADEPDSSNKISFSKQIRPIFNKHCTACHGGVKQAADISFAYRDQVVAPEGSIVEPGEPDDSELIARIISEDEDSRMPPPEHGHGLNEAEVDLVKQWISEGAEWEKHWAYEKPESPSIPKVTDSDWCRKPVDNFILRKLEQESLKPSPEATPARWLRRVTLDLTGLPPTPEERAAFLSDIEAEPDTAHETVVDRLLASPQFGERWASVWLDQVRYADSKGLGADTRRNIWKYRDWVIDSFNDDMPYDQFTIKQIAGDLLPDRTIADQIATAGHRLTQTNEEGGTDDEEFRIAAVLDRVNTTWQTWQGVTFGCVQCHSHPYDPIRHEEFYEFAAFFNNTADCDLDNDWPKVKAPVNRADYAKATELDRQIASLSDEIWTQEHDLLSNQSLWKPVTKLEASTNKATQVDVETVGDREEFFTVDTITKNTDITLKSTLPTDIEKLTAIRLTASPLDAKKAVSDSEWGFILAHLAAKLIVPDEKEPRQIKLSHVIADEPEMMQNPQGSLNPKTDYGWSVYSRIHYPRSAAFVLKKPLEVPKGSRLQVTLKHRVYILASFTMMIRRGHLAVSDDEQFTDLLNGGDFGKKIKKYWDKKKERDKIKSAEVPVLRERDQRFARPSHVFVRGLFLTKDKQVEAGTPECFPPLPAEEPNNRLTLAKWFVSPNNPLTARVAVNRIWAQLFGIGIVATEEDFGSSGEAPSHPELLDYLATRFQHDYSWSTKKMLREIVLSNAYRQVGKFRSELKERDPQNRWIASGPRFRLPAETIRDQSLSISGLLNLKMAGPPVRPPIPAGVWKPFAGGDKWETAKPDDPSRYRRAIYTYTKRSIPYPMFASFDSPSREFCTPRRLRSNTPIQALMTLNDESFVECATAFAKRMQDSAETTPEQIKFGFVLATSREPDESELDDLVALAEKYNDTDSPLMPVAAVLLNLDEVLMK
jgi:hypothetical protein